MVDVNFVYQAVQVLGNKDQKGYFTPEQFNSMIAMVNYEMASDYYGFPEGYQVGHPLPKIAYGLTRTISDALAPFKSEPTILNINSDGRANYPDDYVHSIAMRKTILENGSYVDTDVEEIEESVLGYRNRSQIVDSEYSYPICIYYADYIQFLPKTLVVATLTYFRYPKKPVWGFTMVNGEPVYNSATSTQFEWYVPVQNEIILRTASKLGLTIQNDELIQYSEAKANAGI